MMRASNSLHSNSLQRAFVVAPGEDEAAELLQGEAMAEDALPSSLLSKAAEEAIWSKINW